MKPDNVVDWVILIFIAAALVPEAIDTIFAVDTSTWGAAGTLWDILPVIAIASAVLALQLRTRGGKKA